MTREAGFTRTELIGVALVVLVLLLTSGSLLLKRYERQTQAECGANLKMIERGLQSWSLENKKSLSDTYAFNDFLYVFKTSALPTCPRGGTYSPGKNIADVPRCSFPGHTL